MLNFKKLSLAGILAAGLAFVGCLGEDNGPVPDVVLKVSTTVDPVNKADGALSKSNMISLNKLIIVLTSNASTPDTVRDTITTGTTPSLSATSTTQQVITKSYTLKGLRTWTVSATVRDSKDSVVHTGSITPGGFVKVADTLAVNLTLNARHTMYRAIFASKPDSITTAVTGHKQQVRFKRLVLKVDNVIRVDTTHPTYFSANAADTLYYDYIPVGGSAKTVRLIAYGPVGATYHDSIFAGNVSVAALAAGIDGSTALTLNWVGPNTGIEKVGVTIGKVGTATITGGGYCGSGCVPKTSK